MSTWAKANENLNDIRNVENRCDKEAASLKNEIDGFFRDIDKYVKVLQIPEPTSGTLSHYVQKNSDAARAADKNFIERAKNCADIKSKVKVAAAAAKENFSKAVTMAKQQGLNFN